MSPGKRGTKGNKESKASILHSPNLNTIIMVEETLKKINGHVTTIAELKKKLPRQVNHNTLMLILQYLEKGNKIVVTLNGITWNHNIINNIIKEGGKV